MAKTISPPKTPPQNLEAEQSVLGSILIDSDAIIHIADTLRADDFSDHINGIVYQAMMSIHKSKKPVDIVLLNEILLQDTYFTSKKGSIYLAELMEVVPTASRIKHYADIVKEMSIKRQLIKQGQSLIAMGHEPEMKAIDVISAVNTAISNIMSNNTHSDIYTTQQVLRKTYDEIFDNDQMRKGKVDMPYPHFNSLVGGVGPGNVMIVAARPAVGKTSFAINIAAKLATTKKVGFISMEMTNEELMQRIIAMVSKVNSREMRSGTFSKEDSKSINDAVDPISKLDIQFSFAPDATLEDVRAMATKMKIKHGLDLLIIDYLQLFNMGLGSRGMNMTTAVGKVSRGIKSLAGELEIPIILLSQLNRGLESREKGQQDPVLSDIRDSGNVEQDADFVVLLHVDDMRMAREHHKEIIVNLAKNRHGPTGKTVQERNDRTQHIEEIGNGVLED